MGLFDVHVRHFDCKRPQVIHAIDYHEVGVSLVGSRRGRVGNDSVLSELLNELRLIHCDELLDLTYPPLNADGKLSVVPFLSPI